MISVSVFDLPQIHTKPSGTELLRALDILAIKPKSFASSGHEAVKAPTVYPTGVPRYLTSIISSPLSWLDTDELREAVWDAAAARLSERSGRSGTRNINVVDCLQEFRMSNLGANSNACHDPCLHDSQSNGRRADFDSARTILNCRQPRNENLGILIPSLPTSPLSPRINPTTRPI